MSDKGAQAKDQPDPRRFATTHWSVVLAAKPNEASQASAREALEKLCRAYWYPLYAFVRSRGYSVVDAQDLTQAFFARIFETGGFASADRGKGRFCSYQDRRAAAVSVPHFLFLESGSRALAEFGIHLSLLYIKTQPAGRNQIMFCLKIARA